MLTLFSSSPSKVKHEKDFHESKNDGDYLEADACWLLLSVLVSLLSVLVSLLLLVVAVGVGVGVVGVVGVGVVVVVVMIIVAVSNSCSSFYLIFLLPGFVETKLAFSPRDLSKLRFFCSSLFCLYLEVLPGTEGASNEPHCLNSAMFMASLRLNFSTMIVAL